MIDEQKIIGLLQAKALGCLDSSDEKILSEFIDGGHLFPWDELGTFQSIASLLPVSLPLEQPDPSLKDKIALRLIKLTEEIRAQKIIEEEKQIPPEVEINLPQEPDFIEEESEQQVEEINDLPELTPEQHGDFEEVTGIKIEMPDVIEEEFKQQVEELNDSPELTSEQHRDFEEVTGIKIKMPDVTEDEFKQQVEELNDSPESTSEQHRDFEEVTGIKIKMPDVTEDEFKQQVEELNDSPELTSEQHRDFEEVTGIKTEIPDIIEEDNFNMEIEEATFNLDDVALPDYESTSSTETDFDQIEQPGIENITEKPFEEPIIETPPINTIETFKESSAETSIDDIIESTVIDGVESFNEQFTEEQEIEEAFEETLTKTQSSDMAEQSEEQLIESVSARIYAQTIEPLLDSETVVESTEKISEETTEQVQDKAVLETKEISGSDSEKQPDLTKRSVADKMFKAIEQDFDSLRYHYERSEAKLKRGLFVSYIIIAVLFLLLIFSFFKLSGDINNLLDEIKSLKKNTSSSLLNEKKVNSFYQFFG
ncbi:MAG: hypothetical protein PHY57_12950 [Ignavibacterium sp.]|jgi:hypothetical protein|nr:MAG: hypothetical protein F9K42_01800 [Ignavibacterium sp.]MDD5609418.1 hypothetical protein [Ignavibacterium sp.]MDX9713337.1 hypothetical protein [Ignavibacteriaceae bacterium]MEB2355347.1 hypothetical protein [Ignavibacteriales bacterium]GIK21455.1 MAG: hypothetical protein BroJett005_08690 [Ignavibacteriota bacterium]